jgi:hypothetical protein
MPYWDEEFDEEMPTLQEWCETAPEYKLVFLPHWLLHKIADNLNVPNDCDDVAERIARHCATYNLHWRDLELRFPEMNESRG